MALAGNLRDMALTDLIQITCQEQRQACLILRQGGEEAKLYFDEGEIVHAQMGDLQGEEVVYQTLAWHDGEFEMETGVTPTSRTIETPWSALLMNGLQRYDEDLWDETELFKETDDMARRKANIQELLTEMGEEVQGFMAAAVVGMDGLGIADHVLDASLDMESVTAQLTLLIKLVQTSIGKLDAGEIEDNLLTTGSAYLMTRFLGDTGYFVGIMADRNDANLGNMRLYSRIYAERLAEAMPQ
jgi:predicted regulator of Ras-like GTPase activity (Roadblock/LC7/MglB family)